MAAKTERNAEYWKTRAREAEERAYKSAAQLSLTVYNAYWQSAKALRQQINDFYTRYAREQKLTYDEAVRRLNTREAQEWRKTVAEYLAEIEAEEDKDIRAKLEADYRARSYASRVTRLEALSAEIQMEMNRLAVKSEKQMREEFGAQLVETYDRKMFDIQSRVGYASTYVGLDSKMIGDAVDYPWSGASFSERLWQSKEVLGFSLQSILTKGMISGTSGAQMSKQLSDAMGKSFKVAERLVRTETNRIHAEADMRAYEAAGVMEYEYMCGLDEATCEVCGALDGKHFPIKDAEPGKNYPPMHPNCRCTTIEYDPEDAADWAAAGEPMPENQTYEEWKAKQDKEHGEGYVDREQQKAYNAAGDQKQYERYAARLGSDVPDGLDEFQTVKYENPEAWRDLKELYAYKGRVAEATRRDFELYRKVKATGITGSIRVPPEKINAAGLTFLDSHAGRHGATLEDARSYVETASVSIRRKRWDGVSINFYSKNGAAYIDEEGKIKTSFSQEDYDTITAKALEVFK